MRSTARLRRGLRPRARHLLGTLGFVLGSLLPSPPLAAQEPGNVAVLGGVRWGIGTSGEEMQPGPWISLRLFAPQRGPFRVGVFLSHSRQKGRAYGPDPEDTHPDPAITSLELAVERHFFFAAWFPFLGLSTGTHWFELGHPATPQDFRVWGLSAHGGLGLPLHGFEVSVSGSYDVFLTDVIAREGRLSNLGRLGLGVAFHI